jgi:aspartyl-tRNA(Asn)/glutamyl-tRNA(Gln) amidotransferase subunit A
LPEAWRLRCEALAPLVARGVAEPDVAACAETLASLDGVWASTGGWEWEPAAGFDPAAPFRETPATPWPTAEGTPRAAAAPSLDADLAAVARGEATPARLLATYRQRALALQPSLNAFITICPEDHPQARPLAGPSARPLLGAVLAVKDMIATAGLRTTGGSLQRAHWIPVTDAACWASLRAAGAVTVGKTGTHEFAAGTTGENDAFGTVRNPHDGTRVAGGSSSGSAAAVAAGAAAAALGTDTAGSVRIPAACCGLVGFKPTYGRISRQGVIALSWTLDHVGLLTRTVRDAGLLLAVMAGPDPGGPWTVAPHLPTDVPLGLPRDGGLRGLRLAVPWGWLDAQGDAAPASGGLAVAECVRRNFIGTIARLADLGAEVVAVDLGPVDIAVAVNRVIALAESATYHRPYLNGSPERYGARVRPRLLAGRFLLAEEYLGAQRLRSALCRRYATVLAGPDGAHLVATPTIPLPAPRVGAAHAEGLALLRFCAPFNVLGWPALTLPSGRTPEGLPLGLQLAAAPHREAELLAAAAAVEQGLGAPSGGAA